MNIRSRLTLQFLLINALILILVSLFTYYLSSEFRKEEFFERLSKKAQTTARLLIEIDEIDLDLLKIIDRSDFGTLPEEAIYIYTQEGQLIYQSNDVSIFVPDSSMIERVKRGEHYFEYKKDIEVYGYTYADIDHPYIIIAGALDRFGLSKLNNLRNILVLVFLTGILLVAIAGWIFSGKALSPISDVVSQVNAISINHLERRVDEGNNTDEISLMASTFNRLLDRIEEAFQMQTQFVANASHELRTPLTVLSGQLEVALLKERTPEQYQIILTSLKEDLSLLNQTANRLLLLAQADSRAENLDARPFRLDETLWQIQSEMLKRFPGAEIEIGFSRIPESELEFMITGNEQLIRVAIGNVVENALKYSNPHRCKITFDIEHSEKSVIVEDKGSGIAADEHHKIFLPFYRSPSSINAPGHGLGLAMVKKILQLHKGEITLSSQKGEGTTVKISFSES